MSSVEYFILREKFCGEKKTRIFTANLNEQTKIDSLVYNVKWNLGLSYSDAWKELLFERNGLYWIYDGCEAVYLKTVGMWFWIRLLVSKCVCFSIWSFIRVKNSKPKHIYRCLNTRCSLCFIKSLVDIALFEVYLWQ